MIKVEFSFPLLSVSFPPLHKNAAALLIKKPSPFYFSFCSFLLYILTSVSSPFIPLNTVLDYFLLPFLTLPLAAFLSGCLHLAALDILHFNSNTGFLSPCITDMPQRPWQLPLGSSCHRPHWDALLKLVIFLAMNFKELGSLYSISYSWKHFHSMIKIPLSFSDHNMLSFSAVKCLMYFNDHPT